MIRLQYDCPRCGYTRREAVLSLDDWEPAGECCPRCGATELTCSIVGQGSV